MILTLILYFYIFARLKKRKPYARQGATKMSTGRYFIVGLVFVLSSISPCVIDVAHADDPLKYPPFSWPVDKSDQSRSSDRKAAKSGKPDLYQNKDETKQWFDGDFMGLDDD